MKEPLVLDQTFRDILDQLESQNDHFFVTGKAGTGKSTLLQLFRRTTGKKVVVLSPTGISALHVHGQTIHSFFQFPPKLMHRGEIFINRRLAKLMAQLDTIIIDEISMVRADIMDAIDFSLQLHRKSSDPFGGVQMIFFGDLFQLPPVVSSQEEREYFRTFYVSQYFFNAHVFKDKVPLQMIELSQVFRQSERHFIRLLDSIRTLSFGYEELEELNERYIEDAEIEEPYLTLCSTNASANQINKDRLALLDSSSFFYHGEVKGNFNPKIFPTDYKLELRLGGQVMMIRNDPEKRFVNGSLGKIIGLDEEKITVRLTSDAGKTDEFDLPKMTWEVTKYTIDAAATNPIKSEVIGSFTQYPVKLAWAVTIHKSQGKTYDRVAIDLGRGAFEHGQTYVALSRCRTLNGVFLKKPLTPRDIMVDERVVEFYDTMRM